MPKRKPANLDGFVVQRRPAATERHIGLDDLSVPDRYRIDPEYKNSSSPENSQLITSDVSLARPMPTAEDYTDRPRRSSRGGIDMSLGEVSPPEKKRRSKFPLKFKKPRRRTVVIGLVVLFLAIVGFFGWKLFGNIAQVFNGNPFEAIFGNKELKKDQYGRTNVLIFGTSEDDGEHPGAYLTDSMMIASVSQDKKDAYLLSVPRDLYVDYDETCNAGYQGKINSAFICYAGENSDGSPTDENKGQERLRSLVGNVFGIDLQYSIHLNYSVVKQAVDSVGGVSVKISSDDPRGILDRNFDWKCRYRCYYVKYPNGQTPNLDGEHALALARARGDDNGQATYGLGGGNFDREKYQQLILIALKEKATSAGTLANPVAMTGLLDAMGQNVRTNIDSGEIKSFASLASKIDAAKIKQLTLVDKENPLVTTGNAGAAGSIVRPIAGLMDYSEIRNYVRANISGDASALEKASVAVLNGSGVSGAAQKQANTLGDAGFSINTIGNAPAGTYNDRFTLYDLSENKKPATKAKLEKQLGVKAAAAVPAEVEAVTSGEDFVIIIGSNGAN